MSEHTPGPWDFWDMDEYGFHVFADKFGTKSQGQDCRLSVAAVRYGRSHIETTDNFHEARANARLIAAADTAPHECSMPSCPGGRLFQLLRDRVAAGDAEIADFLESINAAG